MHILHAIQVTKIDLEALTKLADLNRKYNNRLAEESCEYALAGRYFKGAKELERSAKEAVRLAAQIEKTQLKLDNLLAQCF